MALQKTITTAQGFEAINAYHRVEKINVVSKTEILLDVKSYKNKPDPDKTSVLLSSFVVSVPFDVNGSGVFSQAYFGLKQTANFENAADC
jgi:hypothetical protein